MAAETELMEFHQFKEKVKMAQRTQAEAQEVVQIIYTQGLLKLLVVQVLLF